MIYDRKVFRLSQITGSPILENVSDYYEPQGQITVKGETYNYVENLIVVDLENREVMKSVDSSSECKFPKIATTFVSVPKSCSRITRYIRNKLNLECTEPEYLGSVLVDGTLHSLFVVKTVGDGWNNIGGFVSVESFIEDCDPQDKKIMVKAFDGMSLNLNESMMSILNEAKKDEDPDDNDFDLDAEDDDSEDEEDNEDDDTDENDDAASTEGDDDSNEDNSTEGTEDDEPEEPSYSDEDGTFEGEDDAESKQEGSEDSNDDTDDDLGQDDFELNEPSTENDSDNEDGGDDNENNESGESQDEPSQDDFNQDNSNTADDKAESAGDADNDDTESVSEEEDDSSKDPESSTRDANLDFETIQILNLTDVERCVNASELFEYYTSLHSKGKQTLNIIPTTSMIIDNDDLVKMREEINRFNDTIRTYITSKFNLRSLEDNINNLVIFNKTFASIVDSCLVMLSKHHKK
jgi:hypothetical protein